MAKYSDTVETLITARNTATAELRKAESEMRQYDQRERQRMVALEKFAEQQRRKAQSPSLTEQLGGKRGAIDLLAGGAAAAGLVTLARRGQDAVDKFIQLRAELKEGKVSMGELIQESAKLVPVAGDFFALGQKIRSIFDGSAEALAEAQKRIKEQQQEAIAADRKNAAAAGLRETAEKVARDRRLAETTGVNRELLALELKLQDDIKAVHDQAREARMRGVEDTAKFEQQAVEDLTAAHRKAKFEIYYRDRDAVLKARDQRVEAERRAQEKIAEDRKKAAEKSAREVRDIEIAGHEAQIKTEQFMEENARAVIDRARSRGQISGPADALTGSRYLTGVREASDRIDRVAQSKVDKQLKAMEDVAKESHESTLKLQSILDELRKAPVMREERL